MEANDNFVEVLIESIKGYKELYDSSEPDFKDIRRKQRIWEKIAEEMPIKTNGDELKKKWKNLRDSYSKHIRSQTLTGPKAKYVSHYKAWPWAENMAYFKPYMQFGQMEFNLSRAETVLQNLELVIEEHNRNSDEDYSPYPKNKRGKLLKKRKLRNNQKLHPPPPLDKAMSYMDERETRETSSHSQHDNMDLIFLGYAASVKKLSPRRQTLIKFQVAKLIMEEELNEINESSMKEENMNSSSP